MTSEWNLLAKSKKSEKYTLSELNKARNSVKNFGTIRPESQVTKEDLQKLGFGSELAKLKSIHREKILEDLSCVLNDKVRDFERKEQENQWKESMLQKLNAELANKIEQLQKANLHLEEEKKRSDDLNKQLQEVLLKLQKSEEQLKVERDWLAQQVEAKSKEVLDTIREMMEAENKKQNK